MKASRSTTRWGSFLPLLAAMLGELILAPVFGALPGGLPIGRGFSVLVVLAALLVTGFGPIAIALLAATFLAQAMEVLVGGAAFGMLAALFRLLFLARVILLVVRHVLTQRDVTSDTVAGAACAYLLIGVLWGDLYFLIELLGPGSFAVQESWRIGPARDLRAALTVFSMLNLATLGTDAIEPTTPAMGALCAAEALMGQLFMAVLIGRLVGLHASRQNG